MFTADDCGQSETDSNTSCVTSEQCVIGLTI